MSGVVATSYSFPIATIHHSGIWFVPRRPVWSGSRAHLALPRRQLSGSRDAPPATKPPLRKQTNLPCRIPGFSISCVSGLHVIAGCSEYSDPISRRHLQFKRDAAPIYTSDGAYRLYDCSENFDVMDNYASLIELRPRDRPTRCRGEVAERVSITGQPG